MAIPVNKLGDNTSHNVKPDFDSGRGYYWMKQIYEAKKARERGESVNLTAYKPRKGLAENSFFSQVDRRLSRNSFTIGISFDKNGKRIKENDESV